MPRDNMLAELSKLLPKAVDQFTPDGRVPAPEELGPLGLASRPLKYQPARRYFSSTG
jgi:uncharacterized protein YidB (DUF937 family)